MGRYGADLTFLRPFFPLQGLSSSDAAREKASGLFGQLAALMAPTRTATDWTIFWRQLALVLELPAGSDDAALLAPLAPAFYGDGGMSPDTVQ